jgi:NTE family protein
MLSDEMRAIAASTYSAMFGNPRIFNPIWSWMFASNPVYTSPHLYDLDPLKKTLRRYVDFDRLTPEHAPRLIVSATDIRTSESVVFDSHREKMTSDKLAACAGFPFYGISWTKVDGRYLWDGSLLSNTPLREVINASPRNHKRVYIVSLFPKNQDQLPRNLADSWHRARDIMHNDKTDHNIHMSKLVKRYLRVMREMHDMLNNVKLDEKMTDRLLKVEQEYHKLATARGAIIEHVVKIERKEDTHYIFEDADFSIATIKKLIRQGEQEAENALKG